MNSKVVIPRQTAASATKVLKFTGPDSVIWTRGLEGTDIVTLEMSDDGGESGETQTQAGTLVELNTANTLFTIDRAMTLRVIKPLTDGMVGVFLN